MKSFLSTLHRWLGFIVGLIFLISFGTGFLTSIDELLSRQNNLPGNLKAIPYQQSSIAELAHAIEQLSPREQEIRQIKLPSEGSPFYEIHKRGEVFYYRMDTLAEVGQRKESREGFFPTVLQLHRNLLLGKEGFLGIEGAHYVAWVALIALLLSLLGLYLWWPLRRTFALRHSMPRSSKRKDLYYSHMTAGVITLPIITLLALTGAAITYRDIAKQVLSVEQNPKKEMAFQEQVLNNNWREWLVEAHQRLPGAELAYIQFPRSDAPGQRRNQAASQSPRESDRPKQDAQAKASQDKRSNAEPIYSLRFLAPGDWLGLPSSEVQIDQKRSSLVAVKMFSELSVGEKLYAILKPLHTGRNLPALYVVLLLVLSLLGTTMVFSGIVSFMKKKRRMASYKQIFRLNRTV